MIQKTFCLIITVVLLYGCKLGTVGAWKNGNIDANQREQIKILNDQLFQAILNNDVKVVKSLMSDKLLAKAGNDLDQMLGQVSSSLKVNKYRILDEYYVKNTTIGVNNTIPSGTSKDNDYTVHYQVLNKEMYISLLIPDGLLNEPLITVIYGKYSNHWKINILQFGHYSFCGKTAPDIYKTAKGCYDKGDLVDAANFIDLAKQCLKPANNFLEYHKEKEINAFYDKVIPEANSKYSFPLQLENIASNPQILRISLEMIDEGIFPMVYYLTEINIKDTVLLGKENEKIRIEIGEIYKGLDQDKKYVFYRAFNENPIGQNKVEYYGFVDKKYN